MKIAIWGMGVSGVSALKALSIEPSLDIYTINKGAPDEWPNIATIEEYLQLDHCLAEDKSLLSLEFDQIILSPGIDRKSELVKDFIHRGVEVISEIEYTARKVSVPIVAITGTNGKTTTTTMISECLRLAGKSVFTGGNIGVPFCEILLSQEKYDVVVLELSSFQLESLVSFKANIAILLNISESHMERYASYADYVSAKLNIFNNQRDSDLAIAPQEYLPEKGELLIKAPGIDLKNTKIIGDHHLYNLFCVQRVLRYFQVSNPSDVIGEFLKDFRGVAYRLQFTGEKNGLKFYNDAKSTNPNSTLSACLSFNDQEYILIMGGKVRDENTNLHSVLGEIGPQKIYAFGEAREIIFEQLKGQAEVEKLESLDDVFKALSTSDLKGNIVFSPGFPSFDQYKNYLDRGESFERLFRTYFS